MKATVNIEDLYQAMRATEVPVKTVYGRKRPIMHLEGAGGGLRVATTDGNVAVIATIPRVDAEGSTWVEYPAVKASLPTTKTGRRESLLIEADEQSTVLTNGHVTQLRVPAGTDVWQQTFDLLALSDNQQGFTLDLVALRSVAGARCHEDTRPILAGVCVRGREVAATHSYWLSVVTVAEAMYTPERGADDLILPGEMVQVLVGLPADTCEVRYDHRTVVASVGNVEVRGRRIDGSFPNYRQLIPKPSHHLFFTGPEMVAVLKQVVKLNSRANLVRLHVEGNKLTVRYINADKGEDLSFPLDCESDIDITIGFNPSYLLGVLDGRTGQVDLGVIDDPRKPAIIAHTDTEGRDHLRLIMPVRIS